MSPAENRITFSCTAGAVRRMLRAGYGAEVETCFGPIPVRSKDIMEIVKGKEKNERLVSTNGTYIDAIVQEPQGVIKFSAGDPQTADEQDEADGLA